LHIDQIEWTTSQLLSLSKIPSQPISIKSVSFFILKDFISGTLIKTSGFPPNEFIFASGSPNDLLTDKRPGKILKGPLC